MAYNWNAQLAASANAKVKREKTPEELQQEQYKKNQSDFSNWRVVGQGVLDADLDDSKTALARMMDAVGDKNAAYDRAYQTMMGKNTSQTMAEDLRTYLDSFERHGDGAKRIADFPYGSGGGGGRRSATQSGVDFTAQNIPASVTEEADRRIRELQNAIQAAGEAGDYTAADLNAQLKQAKADREAAIQTALNKRALNDALDYYNNPNDLSDALIQSEKLNNRGQTREVRDLTEAAQAQAQRTEADIWNDLYEAWGTNNREAEEALQTELAQKQAQTAAQALGSIPAPESNDPVAPTDRERVEEVNTYEAVDTSSLESQIAAQEAIIRDAQAQKEQISQEAAQASIAGHKEGDPYYDSLYSRYNRQNERINEAERKIAEMQGQLDGKLAYEQSLTPQQRSQLETLSKRIADIDEAQASIARASEVYNQAMADVQAASKDNIAANVEAKVYTDAYRMRADQLNALVNQYNYRADNGADEDTLDILYNQIKEAQSDVNILGNAVSEKRADASAAREEYARAASDLAGAQTALDYLNGRLGSTIGRYYDALSNEYSVPANDKYREAYENVQGLDVLISGYERKLENAQPGEELEATFYLEKLSELKRERANYEAYAFEYEMSRTLAEMSVHDLAMFRKLVENKQLLEGLSNDIQAASASGDWASVGSLLYQSKQAIKDTDYDVINLYRDYLGKLGSSAYNTLLGYVEREENRRKQEDRVAAMKNASVAEQIAASAGSIITNLLSAPGVISEVIVQSAFDGPVDVNAPGFLAQNVTRAIRGTVGENIEESVKKAGGGDKIAKMASGLYSTALSGLDSLVAAGISGVAGGWAGEAVLGLTAASNAAQEAVERGDTVGQSIIRGIVAGTFESLFEHLSIENIGNLGEMSFKNGLKDLLANFGKSAERISFIFSSMIQLLSG